MTILAAILLLLALAGTGYTLLAAHLVWRFGGRALRPAVPAEAVSLLKPLHGAEPRLGDNLASFLDQMWDAPIEMVAGVQHEDDPAIGVMRRSNTLSPFVLSEVEARAPAVTIAARPSTTLGTNGKGAGEAERRVRLIIDPTRHGANAKIANLLNMAPAASHDLIVLSDSDMAVPPHYLATLAATLAQPGVGAVSCLYRGRGDAGFWSRVAAAGSSWQFLPSVLVGLALGQGAPCMGSTIALRRQTLDRIGGFAPFADTLADDHAIGAAVRALGLEVAIAPIVLVHAASETSLAALVRHELRWAATVRGLVAWPAYLGSIMTYPLPLALLGAIGVPGLGGWMVLAALAARFLLVARIDRLCGARTAPPWLLPIRDILSFTLFLASFAVRSVDWRGQKLRIEARGRIVPGPEA